MTSPQPGLHEPVHPHAASGTPHHHSAPSASEGAVAPSSPHGKQFVKFSFFRVRDEFRAAPRNAREAVEHALVQLFDRSADRMLTRTYTTVGTRSDSDFMVWQVADDLHEIMDWHAAFLASELAPVIERSHSFLSMTMRSLYENPMHEGAANRERMRTTESGAEYLFVYPMVKTRAWYTLAHAERQRVMNEHIAIGHAYHNIKINTTYSYGLDDQEFVVAFEGDSPGEFLALVRDLRESESSSFTERDTPMFTCRRMAPEALAAYCGLLPNEV